MDQRIRKNGNVGKLQIPAIGQASIVMWFYFVVLASFIVTETRNSPGYPINKQFVHLMTNIIG